MMLERSEAHGDYVAGALHNTAVIAYAQAFTEARTRHGRVQYKTHALRKAEGFDVDLHNHLMRVRNELIAHSDYTVLPSVIEMQKIGDLRISMTVKVKRLTGIRSRSLAERYRRHFAACMTRLEALLNDAVRDIADAERSHPEAFEVTSNIPVRHTKVTTMEVDLPPRGTQVPEPDFGDLDGYWYITTQHVIPLLESGTYRVRDSDGNQGEITFNVLNRPGSRGTQ